MQDNLNGDELVENPPIDHEAIERAVATLSRRNGALERTCSDAVLTIKTQQVEIEAQRLALAERDNRIQSIQAACDERIAAIQAELMAVMNECAEYRSMYVHARNFFERIEPPLPRLPPPVETKQRRKRGPSNGDDPITADIDPANGTS